MSFSGRPGPEWLIVIVLIIVFWLGPGQAMARGEWTILLGAAASTAFLFGFAALVKRWLARRAARAPGTADPVAAGAGIFLMMTLVYVTVTLIALGAISTLAEASLSDAIPLGTGSATYALLFAALGWRWRHLDDPLSEGRWQMPATVVGLLMTSLSLIALVLRDWLGPVLTSAVAGPFAIVLTAGFLIAALRVPAALLIDSPLSAHWCRYLPGAVFVSGLSTGICLVLHVASGGNLAAVPLPWAMLALASLMAFVTVLLAALFSLRREV